MSREDNLSILDEEPSFNESLNTETETSCAVESLNDSFDTNVETETETLNDTDVGVSVGVSVGSGHNNVIDCIYKSMSKIIEVLLSDNAILTQQVKNIKSELELVCNAISSMKDKAVDLDKLIHDVNIIKTKNTDTTDLRKLILETRAGLIQTMQTIRKEITDSKKVKEEIKSMIAEELAILSPNFDKRFDDLAREHRAMLSQHVRKSTIQRVDSVMLADMIKEQMKNKNQNQS